MQAGFEKELEEFMAQHRLGEIDIAKTTIANAMRLDRVGMSNIECPVVISLNGLSEQRTAGRADAFVSLDEPQKGIHMSRLFLALNDALNSHPISPALLKKVTESFLKNHEGISTTAHVKVSFDLLVQRPALLSNNPGWRTYPVSLWATHTKSSVEYGLTLKIKYSSTCPCSAALARQLIQNKFAEQFQPAKDITRDEVIAWLGKEEAIAGTPHGQRSEAIAHLHIKQPEAHLQFVLDTINQIESALATPVQAAVKREDEQEFARLNASNLMFAEDAARRVASALDGNKLFTGFAAEVYHFESLHPHEAVAKVAGGTLAEGAWL
jgi:GTP cyclohydrolase I